MDGGRKLQLELDFGHQSPEEIRRERCRRLESLLSREDRVLARKHLERPPILDTSPRKKRIPRVGRSPKAAPSLALPVQVRCRPNLSTLGSLRLLSRPAVCWSFSVAESILDRDPEMALLLGRILLHRVRKQAVPEDWRRRFKAFQRTWVTGKRPGFAPAAVPDLPPEDPQLTAQLGEVARRAFPTLARTRLPSVRWMHSRGRRTLGRYLPERDLIAIHGAFRAGEVPAVVLDSLLHHELLHAVLGAHRRSSRICFHHAEFRRRERNWPGFAESEAWLERHLPRLMRSYHGNART